MTRITWRAKAIAVAAACTLALSACGGKSASNGKSEETATGLGGPIVAGAAYETTNYHPSNTSSALAMGTNWHVVEGLWELDPATGKVFKALSSTDEPTKVSDTEYEVKLRDGAKFSDGTAVTADDVVSSFGRATKDGNIYAGMVSFVDSVMAKDTQTVTIKLKAPFTLVKERMAVVKIVPTSATDDALTKMPIGSGPYKSPRLRKRKSPPFLTRTTTAASPLPPRSSPGNQSRTIPLVLRLPRMAPLT